MILEKHMTHAAQPHTLKTVELVGTATNIIEQLKRSIQRCRTVLLSGKNRLGKVNIRRGYMSRRQSITFVICGCSDSCYNNP